MKLHTFSAVIHKEGKWYVADCPEIGTVSQGKTIEGALKNLKEATELFIEDFGLPKNIGSPSKAVLTTFEASFS